MTIAQIALAVVLVIAAGLLVRSLEALSTVDTGFQPEGVVTARINPNASVCHEPARCLAFYRELEEHARAIPGVRAVALAGTPPLGGAVTKRNFEIDVPTERAPLFWLNVVTADYFRVMDIPVQAGRAFTSADLSGAPVVAVAAASARRFWPAESAIGKRIRFVGEQEWRTVVAVVADVRAYDLTRDVPGWIEGMAYVPYTHKATQEDGRIPSEMTLVVRTVSNRALFGADLRRTLAGLNREVVVSDVKSMQDSLAESIATPSSTAWLFTIFAGLALLLGSIGVYGVLSFLVSKRTREIGVRLALGAQTGDITWLIMKEGVKVGVTGIVCGVAGAAALSRALSSELHGISPLDPMTYAWGRPRRCRCHLRGVLRADTPGDSRRSAGRAARFVTRNAQRTWARNNFRNLGTPPAGWFCRPTDVVLLRLFLILIPRNWPQELHEHPVGHAAALGPRRFVGKTEMNSEIDPGVNHFLRRLREAGEVTGLLHGQRSIARHREVEFIGSEKELQDRREGAREVVGTRRIVRIRRCVKQRIPAGIADRPRVAVVVALANGRDRPPEVEVKLRLPTSDCRIGRREVREREEPGAVTDIQLLRVGDRPDCAIPLRHEVL